MGFLDDHLDDLARQHDRRMAAADTYLAAIRDELDRALRKFPRPFTSGHEAYAVILEELDELWEAVRHDDLDSARAEAVQVAAMALRFLVEIRP